MADDYRVYDHKGKSLSGKDSVDRETAKKLFDDAKREAGPGESPMMTRVGEDKPGPTEAE